MIEFEIPGMGLFRLKHLLLDFNGTVGLDGRFIPGVKPRLNSLKTQLEIHLVSADTQGTLQRLQERWSGVVGVSKIAREKEALQKLNILRGLGKTWTIMVGNGANDALALKEAAIGICVIGREGASTEALNSADIVVGNINDGLDLLLRPKRLIASLRR